MIVESGMLKVLDLFSGIGGFSLGLERTGGFQTVAFCEIGEYPRAVLTANWPGVPLYDDVRTLTADRLAADGIAVDAICGGFPCQDVSDAGPRTGISGARSGLWFEYARLIGEIKPQWVIIENVLALRYRGLGSVLRSLHEIGYDAEWHCIPACAIGAPHIRDRIWIVAYPTGSRPHASALAGLHQEAARPGARNGESERLCDPRMEGTVAVPDPGALVEIGLSNQWETEPDVARVGNGLPSKLVASGIAALGNAVVPQIVEMIGKSILHAKRPLAR